MVVFKNESENLTKLIPALLNQDYPNFELVLCDDYSNDSSFEVAKAYDDPRVLPIKATKNLPGKKSALVEAVSFSGGEYILVTDADCLPTNNTWISSMSNHINNRKIVLGYSPHSTSSGLLNKFIRFETYMTGLQYLSYALANIPYMGVGRNMMYKKELFLKSDAFSKAPKLISGDDDLFVNAVATKNNTAVNIDPQSFMATYPEKRWSSFFRQKRRHVSASVAYKLIHKVLLSLYSFSHISIYVLVVLAVILGKSYLPLIGLVIITIIKWIIASTTMKKLACEDLTKYFPLLDFMMVCYYIIMVPSTIFKTKSW